MKIARLLALLLLASNLSGCLYMVLDTPPTKPLPTEDIGPKPDAMAVAIAWANQNYGSPGAGFRAVDIPSISDPQPMAYGEFLQGRKVGWQIIIGPDCPEIARFTGYQYTRLIVNHGRIVDETSGDAPFREVR